MCSIDFLQRYQDTGERIVFSTTGAETSEYAKKKLYMNLSPSFIPYTQTNSKWNIGLNVGAQTIKLLEENTERNTL